MVAYKKVTSKVFFIPISYHTPLSYGSLYILLQGITIVNSSSSSFSRTNSFSESTDFGFGSNFGSSIDFFSNIRKEEREEKEEKKFNPSQLN